MNIKMLGDRVLIETKAKETKTKNGVYIPVTTQHGDPVEGSVVAVGEGKRLETGEISPMTVKVGDNVVFQYGNKINLEGNTYYFVKEEDIVLVNNI